MERKLSFVEAIREATDQEMARDDSVIEFGLDVDDPKAIQGTTKGLLEKYGPERVFGTPLSEDGMTGAAIGMALAGAAGALVSFVFSFFPAKHWEWIAMLMSVVVLGGMGSILGTVVGAMVLSVVAAFVGTWIGATWSTMTFFLALFVVLLVRPQGLFGERIIDRV